MQSFIALFFDFFIFWFFEAPKNMILYFTSVNNSFFKIFSIRVLLRTFFRPWKNEYRQGLVGFSIFMGIFIKSMIISFSLLLFSILLLGEIIIIIAFISWPIATILLLFR
jgi:hypothetical protein